MRIQQTLAAAALVLAGNPVPANNLVPALPLVKPSVVAVGTELPTRTPPVNLGGSGFAVGDGLYIVTNAHDPAAAGYCQSGTDRRDDRAGRGEEVPLCQDCAGRYHPRHRAVAAGRRAAAHRSSAIRIRWSKARRWQ